MDENAVEIKKHPRTVASALNAGGVDAVKAELVFNLVCKGVYLGSGRTAGNNEIVGDNRLFVNVYNFYILRLSVVEDLGDAKGKGFSLFKNFCLVCVVNILRHRGAELFVYLFDLCFFHLDFLSYIMPRWPGFLLRHRKRQ